MPLGEMGALTRYRPRTEGLFARIEHRRDETGNYWQVRSKDGLTSIYGAAPGRADLPAHIADPERPSRIFAWKLSETIDPFGNRIEYRYDPDPSRQREASAQLYLREVRYADFGERGQPQFLITVRFEYEARPDRFAERRAGFAIHTACRCTRIAICINTEVERTVREYRLSYMNQRALPAAELPLNGASLLSQVQVVGFREGEEERLPPLDFDYTRFQPGLRHFFPVTGLQLPAASLAHPEYELADISGDGLPDIIELAGVARYWRNLGGGRFDLPRPMRDAPAGLSLADPGVQLLDADGDGRIDLLVNKADLAGYFPLRFDTVWDRRSFRPYRQAPSFNLEDPEVRLVDLDGDGVTDAIRSGTSLECFFNDPHCGWARTDFVPRRRLDSFPNLSFADPRVKWADMSGDGLQDVVLVNNGSLEYWPALGRGDWGSRVTMAHSPRFPSGYDPRRILLGDVDGDGLADLVYVANNEVTLWINRSGAGWSDPIVIQGTPRVSDMNAVRIVDLLGSGVAGLLWSSDAGGPGRATMHFLDFTGGVKPYLLSAMGNHLGATTRVEYRSSVHDYLEDEARPATRWKTPLPFPVQVVARVVVEDALSGGRMTSCYRYHHGYWDGAEREFRGFGMVEQFDSEAFEPGAQAGQAAETRHHSPPALTKTWFHLGPVGDEAGAWDELDDRGAYWAGDPQQFERPFSLTRLLQRLPRRVQRDAVRTLRGSVLRSELYALDGSEREDRPYSVSESLYDLAAVLDQPDGSHELIVDAERLPESWARDATATRVFFPQLLAQRTTRWERGDDPHTQLVFSGDYDSFGQPRRRTEVACPRGWRRLDDRPAEPFLATRSRTVYARSPRADVYIVHRVASVATLTFGEDSRASAGMTALELRDTPDDSPLLRLIGLNRSYYDGAAFIGLGLGLLDRYGALVRSEALVLTPQILAEAYGTAIPSFLTGGPWSSEYPQGFRDGLPAGAGYTDTTEGLFTTTEQRAYDFQSSPAGAGRGLLAATRDPLGNETTIAGYAFELLPTLVRDPVRLETRADYDLWTLQPAVATDPNDNQTLYTYTPLGLLRSIAALGKPGEAVGDTPELPGVRFDYDLLAFANSPPGEGRPVWVRTTRRVHHASDTSVPADERDATITTVEYSDGFGRLLQTRTQAEDELFGDGTLGNGVLPPAQGDPAERDALASRGNDPQQLHVIVSGWKIYDNKGRVVEQYEPFFDSGWAYATPQDEQRRARTLTFYDPRGQVLRTIAPDGAEQRIVYGVPEQLDSPERFRPTPWERYTYDANDNAGRTHPATSQGFRHHWDTPASIAVDALGRTVLAVARNRAPPARPGNPLPAVEELATRSTYDIRGNLLVVRDPLNRDAFRMLYDLANRPLRVESIDAGRRLSAYDAAGQLVEGRNERGALALRRYDPLGRPTHLWARDGLGQEVTLRERIIYGDGGDPDQDLAERADERALNRLGRPVEQTDEAGLLRFERYDFKGNLLARTREAIADSAVLAAPGAYRVDWERPPALDAPLDSDMAYDGLNRVRMLRYPEDADRRRRELRPVYNSAGALRQVRLDDELYVAQIAYNARGQRTLIVYGNGVITRYAYSPETFRLVRMRSERLAERGASPYRPTGEVLQDVAYSYDLAGNIVATADRAPGCGLPARPDALDRTFGYDALYRLASATGRECDLSPLTPWDAGPRCADLTRTRAYEERYDYDDAGNLTVIARSTTATLTLTPQAGSNRLERYAHGGASFDCVYDLNGNLIAEGTSRRYGWDHADRLTRFEEGPASAPPTVAAWYLYDAGGQRVKKIVRNQQGQISTTTYIDGIFERHEERGARSDTLHLMDDRSRIATLRAGPPLPGEGAPDAPVQYHLGDHLGSSSIVLGGRGAGGATFINREEYYSYGATSYGSYGRKRYRYTGKERDEESGLNYHSARYYAPWVGRWVSCDPVFSENLFSYAQCNPVCLTDITGKAPENSDKNAGVGPYKEVRGDHVHGVAWRTDDPRAKRTSANLYWDSLSTSTKGTETADKRGQKFESAFNRAMWGKDYNNKPAGEGGNVTIVASSATDVGKTTRATPSQWAADIQSLYKELEKGTENEEAYKKVVASRSQLQEAGAAPKRVPPGPSHIIRQEAWLRIPRPSRPSAV